MSIKRELVNSRGKNFYFVISSRKVNIIYPWGDLIIYYKPVCLGDKKKYELVHPKK